jgi:hypothetical protein
MLSRDGGGQRICDALHRESCPLFGRRELGGYSRLRASVQKQILGVETEAAVRKTRSTG